MTAFDRPGCDYGRDRLWPRARPVATAKSHTSGVLAAARFAGPLRPNFRKMRAAPADAVADAVGTTNRIQRTHSQHGQNMPSNRVAQVFSGVGMCSHCKQYCCRSNCRFKEAQSDTVSMALDHPGFLFNALHPGVLAHEIKF